MSPSGDDANSGTSPTTPWKTNARINTTVFHPGDRILFEGGKTIIYADNNAIVFTEEDAGTPANPVIISSYGSGRATINANKGAAIYIYDAGGFEIRNINFVGSGRTDNTEAGIQVLYAPPTTATNLEHIFIDQVEVSGFGYQGIHVSGEYGNGFKDVRLTNIHSHENGWSGIEVSGVFDRNNYAYAHRDFYIGHNVVDNISGIPGKNSGSAIRISQVDGAIIERNLVYNNGWLGGDSNGGPVGIWALECKNVTIQFNESHHNKTGGAWDGGGFDFDAGATYSLMQYNYSHDNDGPGYLLAEPQVGTSYHHNIFRYNISENDSRTNGGAISLWHAGNGINDIEIHNNTIFVSTNQSGDVAAVKFKSSSTNVHLRNNIFIATGDVLLLDIAPGQSGILFQGNDYWTPDGFFAISWQGSSYQSLDDWRTATGQEIIGNASAGKNIDPQVTAPGAGGTIGNVDLLHTLKAYRLQTNSPLIDQGLNLSTLFGIDPGQQDYFGNDIPSGGNYDIGANEYSSKFFRINLPLVRK